MALPDMLYPQITIKPEMEYPVETRLHTLEVLQDILHSRPFTTLILSIAFKESEGSSLFEYFRLFLEEQHTIRNKQGNWNQELHCGLEKKRYLPR
jgi:hypothetical protein